ncbi:N-acetyl-gamma-glutamyl-phosphate reductase [Thalassoglobus neptunius]|uniref:N-acetyl-gamma-glutamyl-phosphate reductase n=1 Tax=Thalassoglobus neptunius TaxID=1938619 RepID=A0A5C5X1J2_9PLAN|nr:N-acetyl-gamma-glutamyl-phosphate reductase [Thalassoglobus neptunius]TWT56670.1 N-acetyl-gamma-glutamyl-phosphate reductase [Thalassoglobus neptunius]
MVRVGVIGGTGYTALEVMRLLQRHPHAEVTVVTSRSETGPVSSSHPSLTGQITVNFTNPDPDEIAEKTDVCFCCLPHKASMDCIPSLLASDVRVVDLSADYRLSDPSVYEKWYGHVHTDPTRLGTTVYGLPELYRDQIRGQNLVANPGCYTSTSILALAPFLKADLIDPQAIIIDAKSGVSGAGRSPKVATLYAECNESFSAYSVGNHRHAPEIEQVLSNASGKSVEVLFTPHLVPMDRGIFATIYATPARDTTESELKEALRAFYSNEKFVRVVDHLPRTKDVAYTNFCDVTVRLVRGRVMILAVLDNMIKGAAGVAVQNFNLISDFDEETALL